MENNSGPSTEPCGTPDVTEAKHDLAPFTTTCCYFSLLVISWLLKLANEIFFEELDELVLSSVMILKWLHSY